MATVRKSSTKNTIIEQVKDSLNDTEYYILTDDSETETPAFYGLPKIHKEYERFLLLCPIVAGYRSATVKLSEYVDSYLKPAARKSFSSFVRGTTLFLNRLRDIKIYQFNHSWWEWM